MTARAELQGGATHQTRFGVATQALAQKVRQLGVAVVDVALPASLLLPQAPYDQAQHRERLVDGTRLLLLLAASCHASLALLLAARQVHQMQAAEALACDAPILINLSGGAGRGEGQRKLWRNTGKWGW